MVKYILASYVPVWFSVKKESSIIHGPRHLFETIKISRYLSENLRKVIGFFHTIKCLLCSGEFIVINDNGWRHVRELIFRRILTKTYENIKCKTLVNFVLPKINFNAIDYIDIIDWKKYCLHPFWRTYLIKIYLTW